MPKHLDSIEVSETGNWNVADLYSKLKIMKPLALLDEYERIAEFGSKNPDEALMIPESMKAQLRYDALLRMAKELEILIRNSKFAVRTKDADLMKKFFKEIQEIREMIPKAIEITTDLSQRKTMMIKEEVFQLILKALKNMADEIHSPLNRADLIFTSVEEFDPKVIKARMMEEIIHGG